MTEFKNLFELLKSHPTEQDCIEYYEKIIWKGKVISPFDSVSKVYKYASNRYRCKNTEKNFGNYIHFYPKNVYNCLLLLLKNYQKRSHYHFE